MRIRSSAGEISIEGSRSELKFLADSIPEFLDASQKVFELELSNDYDPAPYENAIWFLKCFVGTSNEIIVKENALLISGTRDFFENIAKNLPFDVQTTPYHVHYDWISFPQFLNEDSPSLVFEATS